MSDSFLPEQIQAARLQLMHRRPYLSNILWNLIPVARNDKDGLETMAVDKYGRWYINIDQVKTWPVQKIVLGLIHEINHLLRRHHGRMQIFGDWISPHGVSMANLGGDLEINDDLAEDAKDLGTELPPDWAYPSGYGFKDKLLAEEYCELLFQQFKNQCGKKGQKQGGCGGDGQGQGEGQGQGRSQKNNGKNGGGMGHGGCGSCSGSKDNKWEEGPPPGQGGKDHALPYL